MDLTAQKYTERETDALLSELESRGLESHSGRGGGSPYSPEAVVVVAPAILAHGARVDVQALACSHNGAGHYKGRGRTRTIVLVSADATAEWAVCDPTDRDAEE